MNSMLAPKSKRTLTKELSEPNISKFQKLRTGITEEVTTLIYIYMLYFKKNGILRAQIFAFIPVPSSNIQDKIRQTV